MAEGGDPPSYSRLLVPFHLGMKINNFTALDYLCHLILAQSSILRSDFNRASFYIHLNSHVKRSSINLYYVYHFLPDELTVRFKGVLIN